MMRRYLAAALSICLACHPSHAQTWEAVAADAAHYVWGEGWGKTIEDADNQALAMLGSKISLIICNEYRSVEGQFSDDGGTRSYVSIENSLRSYSSALLTDTGVEVLSRGRQAHVVRWISRNQINRIRAARDDKILGLMADASRNEASGRLGDALRGYYWAYALLRANPDRSSLAFTDEDGYPHILSSWLPEKIGAILSGVTVSVQSYAGDKVVLAFSYRGRKGCDMDFSYYDGCRWRESVNAAGGSVPLVMSYNCPPEFIHIRLEYAYLSDARLDMELGYALSAIGEEPLRKAYIAIPVTRRLVPVRFADGHAGNPATAVR